MIPNPAAAAAAVEEELREQQRRLLGLLGASWRPFAPLWPPHNCSAELSPGGASGASEIEDPGSGSAVGDVGVVGEAVGGGGDEASGGRPDSGASGASSPPSGAPLSPWDVALCVTGTAAAGENALALALLCWGPSGPRSPGLLLVASLALADLLSGLGLMVHFAVQHLLRPPSQAATLGTSGLLLTAFSASACSLLALTADRYLSLSQALTYPSGRAWGALVLLWILCAGLGLLPWLGWHCLRRPPGACSVLRPVPREQAFLLAAAFLLLLLLLLQLDVGICRIARRHAQQIAVQRQLGGPGGGAGASSSPRRGLAALALSVGAFALGWMPLALYALVGDASDPPVYASALALPAAAHALLNPILYAFRHPDVQKTLRLACCGCCPPRLASRPGTASDV